MNVHSHFALVDSLLAPFAARLASDFQAYRNHLHRVLNFHCALTGCTGPPPESVQIAAAFHDLGIWTANTFDYLDPSVALARDHLAGAGQLALLPEVTALIENHHKVRPYHGPFVDYVEPFRQADCIDVSLGFLRFGLPASFIREVQSAFAGAGFHRKLFVLTARQFVKSPLRPLPMLRW